MIGQQLSSNIDSEKQKRFTIYVFAVIEDSAALPADAMIQFLAAAVGGDVGEGEPRVHHQAAELRRFGVEAVMSAE